MDIHKQHLHILKETLNTILFFNKSVMVAFSNHKDIMQGYSTINEDYKDILPDKNVQLSMNNIVCSFIMIQFDVYLYNIKNFCLNEIKSVGSIHDDTKKLYEKIFENSIMNPKYIMSKSLKEKVQHLPVDEHEFVKNKISMIDKYSDDLERHIYIMLKHLE